MRVDRLTWWVYGSFLIGAGKPLGDCSAQYAHVVMSTDRCSVRHTGKGLLGAEAVDASKTEQLEVH